MTAKIVQPETPEEPPEWFTLSIVASRASLFFGTKHSDHN